MNEREAPAEGVCANTDREIWRERFGDFYADSIHVTADGGIGINCGGSVIVMPLRKWYEAAALSQPAAPVAEVGYTPVMAARDKAIQDELEARGSPTSPMGAARAGWYAALKQAVFTAAQEKT